MTLAQPIRTDEGPPLFRLNAAQFQTMAEAGVFTGGPNVELRGGLLYEMTPQYVPHLLAKDELCFALSSVCRALGSSLHVSSEGSVLLGDSDVPQPGITVWELARVRGAIPGERVRLAVEVSHTTVADDLGPKRALYAAAAVPEYWVVDLPARVVRQFWAPADGAYARSAVVPFGETLRSATLPKVAVPTGGLDGGDAPG